MIDWKGLHILLLWDSIPGSPLSHALMLFLLLPSLLLSA